MKVAKVHIINDLKQADFLFLLWLGYIFTVRQRAELFSSRKTCFTAYMLTFGFQYFQIAYRDKFCTVAVACSYGEAVMRG